MQLLHNVQAQKDAAKLFHKWANPYKGTVYAKYDTPVEDEDKSRTMQLAQVDDTAAKLRQLAAVSLAKRQEAQASCKGNAGCEKVLQQVTSTLFCFYRLFCSI
jgi:hypothetical protein